MRRRHPQGEAHAPQNTVWPDLRLAAGGACGASALPPNRVQAGTALQGVPRLDGKNIYFSEAFGEASRFDRGPTGLSRFAGLLRLLGANLYTLEWRTGIPADADLLVIAGPLTDIGPDQTAWLWAYLQNGDVCC